MASASSLRPSVSLRGKFWKELLPVSWVFIFPIKMSVPTFLVLLLSIPLFLHPLPGSSQPDDGYFLNCGASKAAGAVNIGDLEYVSDEGFTSVGKTATLDTPDLVPILSTLRYFPDKSARKYCYEIPVIQRRKYLVRTTYYYGSFDGGKVPPVFDQIVEGTKWSTVNTTEDFAAGLSSFYEILVVAMGKKLSVCLARNDQTTSDPFISALELVYLEDSLYNATDFDKNALCTVARSIYGNNGDAIGFPDDKFNRLWHPFKNENPVVTSHSDITPSDFWNIPPATAFKTAITTSRGKSLQIQWPPFSLPETMYYISLYFQDNRTPSPYSWRIMNVKVNGKNFFAGLNVTTKGVTVYASQWPLSGQTQIDLTPGEEMPVGPVINAGEILEVVPLGGRTLPRDAIAMVTLARSLKNSPPDWRGDPCLPQDNSWTGVSCSPGKPARVVALNLTNAGMSGSLPSIVSHLTALTHLWLGSNRLSGSIPEMGSLKELETLHLESNQFEGQIPESLGQLPKLREIFLQNNKLGAKVPESLQNKGIKIQV